MLRRFQISGRETDKPVDAVTPVDVLGDLLAVERSTWCRKRWLNSQCSLDETIIRPLRLLCPGCLCLIK